MASIMNLKENRVRVFDDFPGFYLDDNRKNRHFNPVTRKMLEAKLNVLLPQWLVAEKSILDLGSCLGAAGQWCLYHGASSYTGVEVQKKYATHSRNLLIHWESRVRIHNQDIRSFLAEAEVDSYDVVLMAGVIYLFTDPKNIIDEMCRVATETVVVETAYPKSIRTGKLPHHAIITEYVYEQEVNIADSNESLMGISATSSLRAMDLMFSLNSFGKNEDKLEFPKNEAMLNYVDGGVSSSTTPLRLAARYVKKDARELVTLEDSLPDLKGFRRSWSDNPVSQRRSRDRRRLSQECKIKEGSWKFDETVANQFLEIAEREIPDYQRVINKTVQAITLRQFDNPKIIDVGSALGETLKRLHDNGYRNIYGVDNAKAMLKRSFNQATLIHSDSFPVEYGPYDVIIANWVLHFIEQREDYLKKIKSALNENGMVILTEKLTSSSLAGCLYDEFKRDNGMTHHEIETKRKQIKDVLTPAPLSWYLQTFSALGFNSVDIINANSVFVTFLLQKNNITNIKA